MAELETLRYNLESAIGNIRKVKALLDTLYYDRAYATMSIKIVLRSLIDACIYLESNITRLKNREIGKRAKKG